MLLWVKSISLHKTVPSSWWDPIIWNYLKWFQSISSLQDSRGWDDSSSEVWESLHHRGAFAISNWGPHLADWGYTNLAINQQDILVEHTFFLVKASFFSGEIAIQYHHIFLDQIAIFPGELTIFFLLKSPWNHHEITRFPRVFYVFPWNITIFRWVFPGLKAMDFPYFPRPQTDDVDPKALRRTVSAAPAEPVPADAASPGGATGPLRRVPRESGGWAGRNGETTGKP